MAKREQGPDEANVAVAEQEEEIGVEITEDRIQISMPLHPPTASGSGKFGTVASTHGNFPTNLKLYGKKVTLNCSVLVPLR